MISPPPPAGGQVSDTDRGFMDESERWAYLLSLDDDLLKGGVILSEWCTLIVCEADTAYAHGANLAAILTAVAGAETHLRSEIQGAKKLRLVDLIDQSGFSDELKSDLHSLRRYRNKWVHVEEPWNDDQLLESPELYTEELAKMAQFAVLVLRRTIYAHQFS